MLDQNQLPKVSYPSKNLHSFYSCLQSIVSLQIIGFRFSFSFFFTCLGSWKVFSLKTLTWPPVVSTLIVCNVPCLLVPTFMCDLLPRDWVLLCDQIWPIAIWPDMANPGFCINQGWCNRRPDKHLHIGTCPVGTLFLGIQLAHREATQASIRKKASEKEHGGPTLMHLSSQLAATKINQVSEPSWMFQPV